MSVYRRVRHAAHYPHGGGHDLEQWIVESHEPVKPAGVPEDAWLAHGYLQPYCADPEMRCWVWQRVVPMSAGRCTACPGGAA